METITCEQVVRHLQEIADLAANDKQLVNLARKNNLKMLYEFVEGEQIIPYHFIMEMGQAALRPGALDYQDCDLVIRTSPETLYRILDGQMGSREALMSGRFDIRKAPKIAKLLAFRALFSRYRKSKLRTPHPA